MVLIDNTLPRYDAAGMIMDVHDGQISQWQTGGPYFYYGMGYRNCTETKGLIPPVDCPGIYQPFGGCGFRTDHALNVYTSPDLVQWTHVGDGLPMDKRPDGIYFRPKVVYNRQTQLYVLWINMLTESKPRQWPLGAYPNATYLVATAHDPAGPFAVVNPSAYVRAKGGGDFALLTIGDDAYVAYDAWSNGHRITVEQLDADFFNARRDTPPTAALSPASHEAPVLFARHGWVYLLYGHTCCFCSGGAGARALVSPYPRPGNVWNWSDTGVELNPIRPWSISEHAIPSQNNFVFTHVPGAAVEEEDEQAGGGTRTQRPHAHARAADPTFVFTADLWGSAADRLKSHDRQFWAPLAFDDSASPPTIAPLEWLDNFTL